MTQLDDFLGAMLAPLATLEWMGVDIPNYRRFAAERQQFVGERIHTRRRIEPSLAHGRGLVTLPPRPIPPLPPLPPPTPTPVVPTPTPIPTNGQQQQRRGSQRFGQQERGVIF